jgi:hypothetical protein
MVVVEKLGNKDWQGKPKYPEKTCHSTTLSITNTTYLRPVLNPGSRCGKPATKRLGYGAALNVTLIDIVFPEN